MFNVSVYVRHSRFRQIYFPFEPEKSFKITLHYKKLYPISNNIEVYGEQVWRTKKIPHCAVKFEAGKENRIGTVFLFCWCSIPTSKQACIVIVILVSDTSNLAIHGFWFARVVNIKTFLSHPEMPNTLTLYWTVLTPQLSCITDLRCVPLVCAL